MSFRNEDVVLGEAVSMGANQEFEPINVSGLIGLCIQAIYTGSPEGTLEVQASGDPTNKASEIDADSWIDIGSDAVLAAGNSLFNIRTPFYKWVRLVYTFTSGSGTLVSVVANKRFT
jgi:hypothetical protein